MAFAATKKHTFFPTLDTVSQAFWINSEVAMPKNTRFREGGVVCLVVSAVQAEAVQSYTHYHPPTNHNGQCQPSSGYEHVR